MSPGCHRRASYFKRQIYFSKKIDLPFQIDAVSISLGWATSGDVAFSGFVKVVRYPPEDPIG